MQFNNPTSAKNENQKYDNSTLKKINRPVSSAARFPSHPAGDRRDVRSGGGGGAESWCRGWRFLHVPHRLSLDEHTNRAVDQHVFRGGLGRFGDFPCRKR